MHTVTWSQQRACVTPKLRQRKNEEMHYSAPLSAQCRMYASAKTLLCWATQIPRVPQRRPCGALFKREENWL